MNSYDERGDNCSKVDTNTEYKEKHFTRGVKYCLEIWNKLLFLATP